MGRAPDASILLVEDDEVIATLLIELLGSLGEVHWTTSAEHASEIVAGRDWELLVSDIGLPGIDGLELIRRVKALRPKLATLVLSGHTSFEDAVAALRAGADDYLTKPIDPPELLDKARALIDATRRRRESGREVVLAVGAHPDDVEIGIAGTLLRHVSQGHRVVVLTLTGGEAGGVVANRAEESVRAAELMRAELVHCALEDTSVSEGGATIRAIRKVIEDVSPTIVYTHTVRDVHQDHRNVHSATLVAARGIARVFCYQAPSTTVEFKPSRFVAIDEFVDRKIEVIQAYTSQVKVRAYLDEELLRATARYWARFGNSRYVEPLEVVRDSESSPPGVAVREASFVTARAMLDVG